MPDPLITSTRPFECLDFYTRVFKLQHVPNLELDACMAQAYAGYVFRLSPGSIQLVEVQRQLAENSVDAHMNPVMQEFYFLASQPVSAISTRLQREGWVNFQGPVLYEGRISGLRILRVLDPDGNRLRLVELCY